jgi:uncharacterized protein (DUF2126 family)
VRRRALAERLSESTRESPLGHRLPLQGLTRDPDAEREAAMERSPFEELDPLPGYTTEALDPCEAEATGATRRPPGTALCVETRAEIRVDQLYPPDQAALRLGRIVIGSFETAPEARTAALRTLLLLGLLGRFAKIDDDGTLVRWGSALHDRFMLPHVSWQDLRDVVADLNDAGYPFQLDWFEPILALRFPILGRIQIGPIALELRTAHEPWTLLAEEATGGSVSRFLDVANDRVQVRLTELTPGRYLLVCNDQPVPLQATGTHGECVAGVRSKVWNPPATLHPTHPLPLPSLPPPRVRLGGFLPHGSGRDSLTAPTPQQDPHRPYLLDLTQRGR